MADPPQDCTWDLGLRRLMEEGTLAGYALVAPGGRVEAACGALEADLWVPAGAGDARRAALVAALSFAGPPPPHVDVAGERAVVVRSEPGALLAVSRGRRLSLYARFTRAGVVAAAWGRPHAAPAVVAAVDAALAAGGRGGGGGGGARRGLQLQ